MSRRARLMLALRGRAALAAALAVPLGCSPENTASLAVEGAERHEDGDAARPHDTEGDADAPRGADSEPEGSTGEREGGGGTAIDPSFDASAPVVNDPGVVPGYLTVSAAGSVTCGVNTSHRAICWGRNTRGQLGRGSTADNSPHPDPAVTLGDVRFADVQTGGDHTCGLTTSGQIECWGDNFYGQLGVDIAIAPFSSVMIAASNPDKVVFKQVVTGPTYTCGLSQQGAAYCWGSNAYDQLGRNFADVPGSSVPLQVQATVAFDSLSASREAVCGLTSSGQIQCWGSNNNDHLAIGHETGPTPEVQPVKGSQKWLTFSTGLFSTCGVTQDNKGYCWGRNGGGIIGTETPDTRNEVRDVTLVSGDLRYLEIRPYYRHSCAVTMDGKAVCWGDDAAGQLGVNPASLKSCNDYSIGVPFPCSPAPTPVTGEHAFSHVATGQRHACALTSTQAIFCWGEDVWGQLGDGRTGQQSTPVQVQKP